MTTSRDDVLEEPKVVVAQIEEKEPALDPVADAELAAVVYPAAGELDRRLSGARRTRDYYQFALLLVIGHWSLVIRFATHEIRKRKMTTPHSGSSLASARSLL